MNKQIIFDFDGTIADTFPVVQKVMDKILAQHGIQKLTDAEIATMRNMSFKEVCKYVGISKLRLIVIIWQIKTVLKQHLTEIKPFLGMAKLLKELKEAGYQLDIVTSNSAETVKLFLERYNLSYFEHIRSCHHFLSKSREIKKLMKKRQVEQHKVVYIGDEIRDITAAQKSNIKVIAVSWGLNTVSGLQKAKPNFLVHTPVELAQTLQQVFQEKHRAFLGRVK